MFLLDTCVISELIREKPMPSVTKWIRQQNESSLYVSVLTIGELKKGISKLDDSKKKKVLETWFEEKFMERFSNRTISINPEVSLIWGALVSESERKGKSLPTVDSLIAASALFTGATIVTRNVKDFELPTVKLINPWQ